MIFTIRVKNETETLTTTSEDQAIHFCSELAMIYGHSWATQEDGTTVCTFNRKGRLTHLGINTTDDIAVRQ